MTTGGGWARRILSLAALVAAVAVAMVLLMPSRPSQLEAPTPAETGHSHALEYARTALLVMQEHAYFVQDATWADVVRNAMAMARLAVSPPETYDAIVYALGHAAGPQGLLLLPEGVMKPEAGAPPVIAVRNGLGWISVPTVADPISETPSARGTEIRAAVDAVRENVSCGWVIDARYVRSQADWGLLAGLSGFIQEGEVFQLRGRRGEGYPVSIAMGSVFLDGRPMATADSSGAGITQPIAVLQSDGTEGIGEALVLALRGSDRVRTFGSDTRGLPLTEVFTLADGAQLVLPTARLADTGGHEFVRGVPPQVRTADPEGKALEWLHAQCKQR